MIPEEDGSEVQVPGGFYSKAPWQRFVVLLMGPVFSILAGFALLIPLFMVLGATKSTNRPIIDQVLPKSPAEIGGLKSGDHIVSVNGETIKTWYDVVVRIRDAGPEPIAFVVKRGNEEVPLSIIPEQSKDLRPVLGPDMEPTRELRKQWLIGAASESVMRPVPFTEAAATAVELPITMANSLLGIFKQPSKFKEEVGGPVSIIRMANESTRRGLPWVIQFAGALSISLGIFNLLPISPLDGGQMVVAFVEMLRRGRRLSFRVQNMVAGVGIVLIFALVIGVFAVDIGRLLPGEGGKEGIPKTMPNR